MKNKEDLIGLKIMLNDGAQYISTVLPKIDADEIIQRWESGWYKIKNQTVLGRIDAGVRWAVRIDDIRAMHTFPVEMLREAIQQGGNTTPWRGGSGLN